MRPIDRRLARPTLPTIPVGRPHGGAGDEPGEVRGVFHGTFGLLFAGIT